MKKSSVKKVLGLGLGATLLACSALSHAENFQLHEVTVKQVLQWSDGHIFVSFNKQLPETSCSSRSRVGFHRDDPNAEFFKAQALTALATGKPTYIRANTNTDGSCPVHSNSMKLNAMAVGY